MVMLSAFFDESYNHRTKDNAKSPLVYTVAGCVGTQWQWTKFQKKWKRVLDGENLPFFHMTDFDNPHDKVYGKWPKEKKVEFLKTLHKIMERNSLRRFSVGIVMSDYDGLTNAEKYAFGNNPHLCAIITCMKHIGVWANQSAYKERMQYIFEAGSRYDADVRRFFKDLTEEEKEYYRVGGDSYQDKKRFPPLQAADIIALETRKELSRQLESTNTRKARQSIRNLRTPSLDEWFYMDRQAFEKAVAQMKRSPLAQSVNYSWE